MPKTAVDTSVLVAALLTEHDAHPRAHRGLEEVLSTEATVILPVHALLEAYSVMTRLPSPFRLSPQNAFQILRASFETRAKLVGFTPDFWLFLEDASSQALAGGIIYDAQILASAIHGGANRILTLNQRDFERIKPEGFEVVRL